MKSFCNFFRVILCCSLFFGLFACRVGYYNVAADSTSKEITAYYLKGESKYIQGNIDQANKTIFVEMPFSSKLDSLVAKFTITGARVKVGNVEQISETTANNFTSSQNYDVEAADGSVATYKVNVKNANLFNCLRDDVTGNRCACLIQNDKSRLVWYTDENKTGAWIKWCDDKECRGSSGEDLKKFNQEKHCGFSDWHLPSSNKNAENGQKIETVGGEWGILGILAISNGWQSGKEQLFEWLFKVGFHKLKPIKYHPYWSRYLGVNDYIMAINVAEGIVEETITYDGDGRILLVRGGD